jgi:hypothetical protein
MPIDRKAQGTLTVEEFLVCLSRTKRGGPVAVAVAQTLLRLLADTDLQVKPRKSSFAVHAPDPVNPGKSLSLAVIAQNGTLWCYQRWLRNQITDHWGAPDIAQRLVAEQAALFKEFGGAKASSGNNIIIELEDLKGHERDFVEGLCRLYDKIVESSAQVHVNQVD